MPPLSGSPRCSGPRVSELTLRATLEATRLWKAHVLVLPPSQSLATGVASEPRLRDCRTLCAGRTEHPARTAFILLPDLSLCSLGDLVLCGFGENHGAARRGVWTGPSQQQRCRWTLLASGRGSGPRGRSMGPGLARGGRAVGCRPPPPGCQPRGHTGSLLRGVTGSSRPARRCSGLSKVQTWPWPHSGPGVGAADCRGQGRAGGWRGQPGHGARATGQPAFLLTAPRALEQLPHGLPDTCGNMLAPDPQAWAWVQQLLSETLPSVNVIS